MGLDSCAKWNMQTACEVATLFLAVAWAPSALAQSTDTVAPTAWDSTARDLMKQGRLAEAATILDARLARAPRDVQARFLKGMIALAGNDHREAIRAFRAILIDQPGAARVRLELARAFFLAKDYRNSFTHFQFALASNPPEVVKSHIRQYLGAIREAKSLSYTASFAVAPDTNLNAGSSAREVSLFGLPFDLSEDARRRSGVGVAIEAGAQALPLVDAQGAHHGHRSHPTGGPRSPGAASRPTVEPDGLGPAAELVALLPGDVLPQARQGDAMAPP